MIGRKASQRQGTKPGTSPRYLDWAERNQRSSQPHTGSRMVAMVPSYIGPSFSHTRARTSTGDFDRA